MFKMPKPTNPHAMVLGFVAGLLVINYFVEKEWITYLVIATSVLCSISGKLAHVLASLWLGLGHLLGRINGAVLLSLLYLLILTPLALLRKLVDRKKRKRGVEQAQTAFVSRSHLFTGQDIELPW